MLLAVTKSGQFQENFTKKNYTLFLLNGDLIFFKWLVYMFVKAKGLNMCKTILQKSFGAWGCL